MILPVGPVFQYRKLLLLLEYRPLDLSGLHLFFMDEYLEQDTDELISPESPLSFRGFIEKELIQPMPEGNGFNIEQIYFPNPKEPEAYDARIASLGGIDLCQAGVGIVGHLAFNEPMAESEITLKDFMNLPTRIVDLTRETITINSNTALLGAFEEIPKKAVTAGMAVILGARCLEIYLNRQWQAAVLRKALLNPPQAPFLLPAPELIRHFLLQSRP